MPACVGAIFVATLLISAAPTAAAPFRPKDGATVIYVVPLWALASRVQTRDLQARLRADPGDLPAALQVARVAIREGRASADPRLYGRAQAALGPWWSNRNPPLEVRVLRAIIRQALHDFAGALEDLDAVLEVKPDDGQARLTRAFVLQAVGALDRAAADCRVLPASIGPTAAVACSARMAAATGDGDRALDRLTHVASLDRRADSGVRRFGLSVAAEIASASGRDAEAERFLAAAAEGGTDLPSLVAYADFLLDAKRAPDVLTLLADHADVDAGLLRLAIAAKVVGDPRAPDWASLLAERFAVARAGAGPLHLREEARFELEVRDRPDRALMLARENWAIEKEPQDARLVLQTALAASRPEAASDVLEFILATGLVDRRIEPLRDRLAALRASADPRPLDRLSETR